MRLFLILLFTISCANLCNPVFAQFGSTTIKQIDQIKNNNGTDIILDPVDKVMINYFTGGFALQSSGSSELQESSVTNTELSYLSGTTSSVQDQLDDKEALLPWMNDGDLVYYDLASATALAIGTNGQILTVSGGLPSWQNAPVSTTLTAKGDIQTHNGTNNATLAVGTNGQVLKANSATATGLEWVNDTSSSIFSDAFITVNDGNDQVNADGTGGLLLTMTDATDVALNYDSGVASQFVMGEIGDQHEVVTTGHTQSLVDKTIDLSSIVNPVSIEVKLGTQAQLETHAATAVSGELAYATDTKAYYGFTDNALVDLGGGGGGFNYIENPTPKIDTSGWVRYATSTPSATPIDFAGIPAAYPTWTRNTTNALNNVSDFLLQKDPSDRQGEGIYYEFDIENGDKTVMQLLQFYKLDDLIYEDGDIAIFVVTSDDNFTTQNIIYPANQDMLAGIPTVSKQFQFNSTDTKGRLCIHIASNNVFSYNVQFNDFALAQSPVATSAVVMDWEEFTPTGTWIANTTYTGFYRRVGDSAEVFVRVALAGAPTSATLQVNLPSGLALDTTKTADAQELGTAWISDSSTPTNRTKGSVSDGGSNNLQIFYIGGSTVTQAAPFTFATGDEVVFRAIVPIQGWSSNAASSIDLGARDIRSEAVNSTVTAIGVSGAVHFGDVQENVGGNFWLNSTQFTPPETNDYSLNGYLVANASQTTWSIYVYDVTAAAQLGRPIGFSDGANAVSFSGTKNLIRGHTYELRTTDGYTPNSIGSSGITIKKFSSGQSILDTETFAMKFSSGNGQSVASGASLKFEISNPNNTHEDNYSVGTGLVTAPINGWYQVNGGSRFLTTGDSNLSIHVNGTSVTQSREIDSAQNSLSLSDTIYLNKGDTVGIYNTSAASRSLSANSAQNYFSIYRVK